MTEQTTFTTLTERLSVLDAEHATLAKELASIDSEIAELKAEKEKLSTGKRTFDSRMSAELSKHGVREHTQPLEPNLTQRCMAANASPKN